MRVLWSVLLLLLLVPSWSGEAPNRPLDPATPFFATPVAIREGSANRSVGRLTFLRGYRLTSRDPEFGGFSSIDVQGDRFTLLSDGGQIIRFRLNAMGRLSDRRIGALPSGPGTGWFKEDRDSESMVRDPATGTLWVGFENWNAIWRFAPGFAHGERGVFPRAMRDWPENGGPEAMVRLTNGRFLVFAEQQEGRGGHGRAALRFATDPTRRQPHPPERFTYLPPPGGFVPSDATQLDDGRVLLLNRAFSFGRGFEVAVTVIDPAAIRAGGVVRGTEISRFSGAVLHDNYEGVAVAREGGRPVLWIVSDDNQNAFQQTLLLEFALNAAPHTRGR